MVCGKRKEKSKKYFGNKINVTLCLPQFGQESGEASWVRPRGPARMMGGHWDHYKEELRVR